MFSLVFDVMGDTQVARGFSRFADDIKDLRPAFKEIVKDFHEGEERQFETGGHYGAGGWQQLAPSTLDDKARRGYPTDILIRTRALMRSLMGEGPSAVEKIKSLSLVMGTEEESAAYHQTGTRRMPARPVIMLPEEQKTRWHKIVHRHLFVASQEAFR